MAPTTTAAGNDSNGSAELSYPMERSCPFDPPPELAVLRAERPITRVRLWDGSTPWLVTRYADIRKLLVDPRVSADDTRPGYPFVAPGIRAQRLKSQTFITMDDPDHARHRKMVLGEFTVRATESLRPLVEKIVDDLLDAMERGPRPVDLVGAFALPLPSMVICRMMGVPYADHDFFQSRSRDAVVDNTVRPEVALRASAELEEYLSRLMTAREAEPTDDLLGRLAQRYVLTGRLSREEAVAMALMLLIAGHESTANMIALGMLALLQYPEQAAEVRDGDPSVVKSAVEELLRLLTVSHSGRRRVALEDIEIGGVTIRAGEGIIGAGDSANRDEAAFESPDELDIHRSTNHHFTFGFGVHQCLGQPLARLELQVAYPALLRRFPDLHAAVPLEQLRFRNEMAFYGVHALPVSW
jgi:cytochrome P450